MFSPERLFARIARNLSVGGTLFMVNQGTDEADVAAGYCRQAGASFRRPVGSTAAIASAAPSSGRLLVDGLAECGQPPPAAFSTSVNRDAYLIEGRRMAGGVELRVTTPTLDFRPYAMSSMPYAFF